MKLYLSFKYASTTKARCRNSPFVLVLPDTSWKLLHGPCQRSGPVLAPLPTAPLCRHSIGNGTVRGGKVLPVMIPMTAFRSQFLHESPSLAATLAPFPCPAPAMSFVGLLRHLCFRVCQGLGTHPTAPALLQGTAAPPGCRGVSPRGGKHPWRKAKKVSGTLCPILSSPGDLEITAAPPHQPVFPDLQKSPSPTTPLAVPAVPETEQPAPSWYSHKGVFISYSCRPH